MRKPLSTRRALLEGALAVWVLDALDAIVFYGIRLKGFTPTRMFQSIAAGLLGRAAFRGGVPAAILGMAVHFCIALSIVSVYFLASSKFGVLTRQAVACGLLYGVLAYFVMNFIVLPLSAVGRSVPSLPVMLNGLIIHALGVGLPSALFARAATGSGKETQ